jgi:hypothetical protein
MLLMIFSSMNCADAMSAILPFFLPRSIIPYAPGLHAKQGQAPDGVTAHARAHKHSALAGGCMIITTGSYAFVFAFPPGCSATCADE